MADPAERPSLRLIAGDLVNSADQLLGKISRDVETLAEAAAINLPRSPRPDDDGVPAEGQVPRKRRIVIIGGGIAGLTAAWTLVQERGFDSEVVIFESSGQLGGKLRLIEVEGQTLDGGAESLLALRPEATGLAKSIGLADDIVNPAITRASVLSYGQLRPLPDGLISGIPTDLRALAVSELLSAPGLLRVPLDHVLARTPIDGDISIGEYVGARLGREVVDRLVEPMLGGVYAGRADLLSLDMAMPALFRNAQRERSLLTAARETRAAGAPAAGASRGPVFAGINGGVGRIPIKLAEQLAARGVVLETGVTVVGLRSEPGDAWRLLVSNGGQTQRVTADAVILAVPAPAAAKLLRGANPQVSKLLDTVSYASVALATLLYRPEQISSAVAGSGFLVPPIEGHSIKAATFSSRKWAWTKAQPLFAARASFGRYGEPQVLQRDDAELAGLAASELHLLAGLPRTPVAFQVTRWGGSLPQYAVGHRGRMARARELLADTPGLSVCGAAYDGVGIAACIGSAQFAAGQAAAHLTERGQWANG